MISDLTLFRPNRVLLSKYSFTSPILKFIVTLFYRIYFFLDCVAGIFGLYRLQLGVSREFPMKLFGG